ncbi:basement membrane-specific heparan sulfate proteoglycan core protein isoform X1 [Tachysurus ichikawai]
MDSIRHGDLIEASKQQLGKPQNSADVPVVSDVAESSKVWGEVPFLGDLEAASVPRHQRYLEDDEDFANNEASGYSISGEEDGSTPEPPVVDLTTSEDSFLFLLGSLQYVVTSL